MKVKLMLVGRTVEEYLRKGISIYAERIPHYISFEIVELPDLKQTSSLTQEQIKTKEGEMILKALRSSDHLVLLDERGKMFSSKEWARDLEQKSVRLSKDVIFVIGGPYGFSKQVYDRCDEKISLSPMTFSHQLVRVIFMEQLYRACTIIKGEPYHHE
ncbi:MAG: 23S rRNA (pseudouridine(1915)-N(3))-methyltransferase RlmH [Bacteroidales bacterium]|nr:23S rRNA (pseudouridine(1915)-N(3))-methyltransferase RlmH [Candidatus Cacconaster merdequi]